MGIVTIDFETTYTSSYSLSKMSEVEYILDPRFQTIMCAVKVDDQESETFIGHAEVARRLSEIDWSTACLLAHNTRFDGSILAWHYGRVPALYLDTLSMARATTHWVLGRSSLAKVSEYLGLPPKGDEVVRAINKRLEDFSPSELSDYAAYCRRDNDNCRMIFDRLRPVFISSELRLIDNILRMFILPQVKLDPNKLAEHLAEVKAEKAAIMARVAHVDPSVFSSNQKFAALLQEHGLEVPMKVSPTTGEDTFALAKGDRAFKELLQDDSQPLEIQALLAARVNSKSTLEETRTQTLLNLSLLDWPPAPGLADISVDLDTLRAMAAHNLAGARGLGWGPVPCKFYGSRTGRMSGDGGTNWLNFRRGSIIRAGIVAPPGHRVVHRDSRQIEARMVAWLARCETLLAAFRDPARDSYCEFASSVYGRTVTLNDKGDRFVGKTGVLGLGYGCGAPKFRHMLFIGNGGMSFNVDEDEARRIVYHYRNTYHEIPVLWADGEVLLHQIVSRSGAFRPNSTRWNAGAGAHTISNDVIKVGFDALWLPNGMCIAYPKLRYERTPDNKFELTYDDPYGGSRKIYGAKTIENISQALSRIVVTDIIVRMFDLTGAHPFLSTYDSIDYCVPESDVMWWDQELERQFAIAPSWANGLPLASEGGWGRTLLDAERMVNE